MPGPRRARSVSDDPDRFRVPYSFRLLDGRAARDALSDMRTYREESRQRADEVARLRTELAALPPPANDRRNAA